MKVVKRVGEQANMIKKVEGYNLKFIHSNWNSKFGSNIYYDFEMIFGVLLNAIFGHAIYHFKAKEFNASNSVQIRAKMRKI